MANQKPIPPPEKYQFKKGWKGGPGRPGIPAEVKAMRDLTRNDLVDIAMMVFRGDVTDLTELLQRVRDEDPAKRPTPIQVLMASCMLSAIKKGDATVLNSLLDRFFGRTPIAIQVNHTEDLSGSTAKTIVFETVDATATG